jgi:hypothetical protein
MKCAASAVVLASAWSLAAAHGQVNRVIANGITNRGPNVRSRVFADRAMLTVADLLGGRHTQRADSRAHHVAGGRARLRTPTRFYQFFVRLLNMRSYMAQLTPAQDDGLRGR